MTVLTLEYKIDATTAQYAAMDEGIRTVQFIRNKCLRRWMDAPKEQPVGKNDLQTYCAVLAAEFPFAAALNSQARQASADRAWSAISRFYDNCAAKKPGKKGYPRFQHDGRSVEYKTTGWKLEEDGRHITFTDGIGIERVRLIGKKETGIAAFAHGPVIPEGQPFVFTDPPRGDMTARQAALAEQERLIANGTLMAEDVHDGRLNIYQDVKRVRIVRRADGYYCQFCVDTDWEVDHQPTGIERGIDVGLNAYYTDSEGEKEENPRFWRKAEEKIKRLQRQVSHKSLRHKQTKKPKPSRKHNKYPNGQPVVKQPRQQHQHWHTHPTKAKTFRRNQRPKRVPKPSVNRNIPPEQGKQSHNYQKARKQVAQAHLTVQRQREDFARKTASALISSSDLIAFEDLQIRNLVKNHHLAKSINDAAWGRFLWWMQSYARQHDIPCIAVPPQFTSQDCSGTLPDGSRCQSRVLKSLSVRTHVCPRCGLVLDRDHNSARLIKERALYLLARHLVSVPSGRRKRPGPAPGQRLGTGDLHS